MMSKCTSILYSINGCHVPFAMSAKRLDVVSQIGWIRGMEETHTSVKSRCAVEPRWVEPVSWMIPCHLVLPSISQWMILPNEIFEKHNITIYPDFFLHHDTDLCHYKNNISHFLRLFCLSHNARIENRELPVRCTVPSVTELERTMAFRSLSVGRNVPRLIFLDRKRIKNQQNMWRFIVFFPLMNAWNPTLIFHFAIFSQGKRSIITAISAPFCSFGTKNSSQKWCNWDQDGLKLQTRELLQFASVRWKDALPMDGGAGGAVWVGNADHLGLQRWLCCRTEGVWFRDLGGRN